MKRKLLLFSCVAMMIASLCGCNPVHTTKHVSYTYSVETGDRVEIKLDTTDNFSLSSDLPFQISQNDEVLSQGIFMSAENYNTYLDTINNDENAEVIDSGQKDGFEYVMWNYGDKEYDYAILIEDSNTGILLGNDVSEESAKECFRRLTISLK